MLFHGTICNSVDKMRVTTYFSEKIQLMKKPTLLSLFLLISIAFSGFSVFADKPRAKGYYINSNGETIKNIMVEVPTKLLSKKAEVNQQMDFTVYVKGKKVELNPSNAKEIGFTYEGEEITFRLLPAVLVDVTKVKGDFYKLILDGHCEVYLAWQTYGNGFNTEYILYKDENNYYVTTTGITGRLISAPGRIGTLEELFQDCPDLVEKLKTKEFKKADDKYMKAAQYYNASCQSSGGGSGE